MKNSKIISVFIILTLLIGACSSPSQKEEDTKRYNMEDNIHEANGGYMTDMANYKTKFADKIAANEVLINNCNAQISSQKKYTQSEYKQKVAALEQKNIDMKKKMDDYKLDGKENWEQFKTEFNHDMDELGKAFDDLTVDNVK